VNKWTLAQRWLTCNSHGSHDGHSTGCSERKLCCSLLLSTQQQALPGSPKIAPGFVVQTGSPLSRDGLGDPARHGGRRNVAGAVRQPRHFVDLCGQVRSAACLPLNVRTRAAVHLPPCAAAAQGKAGKGRGGGAGGGHTARDTAAQVRSLRPGCPADRQPRLHQCRPGRKGARKTSSALLAAVCLVAVLAQREGLALPRALQPVPPESRLAADGPWGRRGRQVVGGGRRAVPAARGQHARDAPGGRRAAGAPGPRAAGGAGAPRRPACQQPAQGLPECGACRGAHGRPCLPARAGHAARGWRSRACVCARKDAR